MLGLPFEVMERVVDDCCRDDAKCEPHDADMVSAWEFRLLSVDMGLLLSSWLLWNMLWVTCMRRKSHIRTDTKRAKSPPTAESCPDNAQSQGKYISGSTQHLSIH